MNLTTKCDEMQYKDVSLAPQDTIQEQLCCYTIQPQHSCKLIRLHQTNFLEHLSLRPTEAPAL